MRAMGSLSSVVHPTTYQPVCHNPCPLATPSHISPNALRRRLSDDGVCATLVALFHRIAWCCFATALLISTSPATAQDTSVRNLLPPSPDVAFRAFHAVRRVLVQNEGSDLPEANEHGTSITLRLDGRIIARASVLGNNSLRQALLQAQADVDRWAAEATDLAGAQARRRDLRRATLSLELAGPLIPVTLQTFAECDVTLAPGLDGVAVRAGERVEGVFPGTAILSGKTPGDALAWCLATILADPSAPLRGVPEHEAGALAARHTLTFYRFGVTHLAQLRATEEPRFLHRSGRVVPEGGLGRDALREFTRRLAEHLCLRASMHDDRVVLIGTRHPATGRDDPAIASPSDQALAALALAEYARREEDRGSAQAAAGVSRAVLRSLAPLGPDQTGLDDPSVCALWLLGTRALAGFESDEVIAPAPEIERARAMLAACFEDGSGWNSNMDQANRALVACALAAGALDAPPESRDAALARAHAAVRSLFRETPAQELVLLMPWLLRAELFLANSDNVPSAPALREFRRTVWAHQVPHSTRPEQIDHTGGIVFTAGGNPYPTWLSIAPLDTLAIMLADDRLTDEGEMLPELSRLLAGLRFVRQLALDDDAAYLAVDRRTSLWGIRISTWDPRQPLRASALALLALCDADRALAQSMQRLRK
jgi:hypothetical protein